MRTKMDADAEWRMHTYTNFLFGIEADPISINIITEINTERFKNIKRRQLAGV